VKNEGSILPEFAIVVTIVADHAVILDALVFAEYASGLLRWKAKFLAL
jgi:hypothetical protein